MRRWVVYLFILLFIFQGCGHLSSRGKDTDAFNYDNVLSFIMRNQKKESEELYRACEEILPIIVKENRTEDYKKVITVYKNNPDVFSRVMTLGSMDDMKPVEPELRDSVFAAVERAERLARSGAFFEGAREYYADRDFSEDELRDRVTALSASISDNYGQLLTERKRHGDALRVYEALVDRYKDSDVLRNYAEALNNMNRYEESLIVSIEALKMAPGSLDAKAQVAKTAELLGYSRAEINTMVDETVFVGRNILRQDLLADELNTPMPSFSLQGVNTETVSSEYFDNKILIVNFFATWCPPCRKELPLVNDLYVKYLNDPMVDVIAISIDRDTFLVPPFVKDNNLRLPVYFAGGVNKAFEVKGVPTIFIIDPEGIIRYKKIGYADGEEFEKIMSWYIDEIKAARGV